MGWPPTKPKLTRKTSHGVLFRADLADQKYESRLGYKIEP
eukprot:CAMPEP_0183447388 /NCGR_PEP_ID=MMETSP0370-20130417/102223_1 /TAXON_ID=268820 /ORGANISM="Peridinium aciculiferum, Strain PAER-2" /LENGTH=39 /DNA_ID= /DNA_START= /DNA_END= /DNA_ORIENTATION=